MSDPVLVTERAPERPLAVWLVAIVGALLTLGGAWLLLANPPDQVVLVSVSVLLALYGYTNVSLLRGQGWARALLTVLAIGAISLALVAVALSAGDGKLGAEWMLATAILVVQGSVLALLLSRPAATFVSPVAWRESFVDVKWAISLLFLVMLALFGVNNGAWAREPTGRENVPRLVDLFLSPDATGLGAELPQMFLIQLLGILLVAGLIAALVIAIRDPHPDEETEAR